MTVHPVLTSLLLVLSCGLANAQDPARLIAQGDSLLLVDKPQKAADKYTQAIELDGSARSYSARARAWFQMDRMDRFLLDAQKALNLDSLYPEANFQCALYAYRGEDHLKAERLATRGLESGATDPLRSQLLVLRGEARAELKKNAQAAQDLREGLNGRTNDLLALRTLARTLDATGDHAGSLAVQETLCTLEPGDIGNWTNRGFELAALGRYAEALKVYDQALALDKDEPTVLSNRASVLLELGREEEALADVERSLHSYPANAFALRTRGVIRLHKGQREKACEDLQLARIIGGVPDIDQLVEQNCSGLPHK